MVTGNVSSVLTGKEGNKKPRMWYGGLVMK